jgi:hypothetical protein
MSSIFFDGRVAAGLLDRLADATFEGLAGRASGAEHFDIHGW